jgi:hypothetical protein
MITNNDIISRFMEKVDKTETCWEWKAVRNPDGYGNFKLDQRMVKAHRISYLIFNGDITNNLCVLHSCDNPGCVNPAHLTLGTQQDNANDREAKGRGHDKAGEANGRAKLTEKEVWQIKDLYKHKIDTQRNIGRWYGISHVVVSKITLNQLWKEAKNPYEHK